MNFKKILLDEIDSTNIEAKRLVQSGSLREPTLILAKRQSIGRGSRGRSWSSPAGNVYASFVFPWKRSTVELPLVVYPISLATRATVANFLPNENTQVKWPNDVLVNGRKISGALHEICEADGDIFFVAGIGINIASKPDTNIAFPPACFADFVEQVPKLEQVVESLGSHISDSLDNWTALDFSRVREEFCSHAFRIHEQIEVSTTGDRSNTVAGIFRGIDSQGRLVLEGQAGTRTFSTGTVFSDLGRYDSS